MAARKKAVVTAEEVKAVAQKADEIVKEVRKTTRRTGTRKTAKPVEPEVSVILEYQGVQTAMKDILAKAMEAYKASHEGAEVKTMEIYVKPEEKAAYYVVNGEGSTDFKVEL